MASKLEYLIVRNGDVWSIVHRGFHAGEFATREAALEAADRLAREAAGIGYDAEVKALDDRGQARREREYHPHPV
ncbi:hypothetical protein [Caulobacter sp. 17J80-11]|uniref:hypothetical protein n=1 Tax=Caulobacter sp. 17J80-11 TaxID=2763502 RepID=UPI001653A891|nr:hypothetical protein [Caulobacter sp. 17J80-11]MBC6980442.1 hypothetical protein [Caulobacter sp. 17J80-11]